MLIHGSCHCGNIAFELDWRSDPDEIPARVCGCTFCTKHGGVWTSSPAGSLRVTFRDRSQVRDYAFGTRTAKFHVCCECGVVPVVTSEIEGRVYAVVNTNSFDDLDRSMLRRSPASFDGEDAGSRLARRTRNWISDVLLSDGDH